MALFVIPAAAQPCLVAVVLRFHKIQLAAWWILLLFAVAAATAYAFWRIRRLAGWICLPISSGCALPARSAIRSPGSTAWRSCRRDA